MLCKVQIKRMCGLLPALVFLRIENGSYTVDFATQRGLSVSNLGLSLLIPCSETLHLLFRGFAQRGCAPLH